MNAAPSWLANAILVIAWDIIGAAMACLDCARQYTMLRTQFDDWPMTSHQLVQNDLAWMITAVSKMQFMHLHATSLSDQGRRHHGHVPMIKRNYAAMALDVAIPPRDLLGANRTTNEDPIFQHTCDLETVKPYEGTHNIHTLIPAAEATGIQAFQ